MVIFSDLLVISDQNIPKIRKVTILTTKQCSFLLQQMACPSEIFLVGEGACMWAKSKGIPFLASIPEADEVNSPSFLNSIYSMSLDIGVLLDISISMIHSAYDPDNPVIEQQRVATVQGLSRTGSLRLAVALIERDGDRNLVMRLED
ncbi:hypothetical protein CsSME_00011642 [Camellia sinensis var. sinensis]